MQSIKFLNASDGTANASLMTVQTLRSPGASAIIVNTVSGVHTTGFHASMGAPHTFTDPITSEVITVISDATAVDFAGHINAGQIIIDAIAPGYVDTRGSLVGDIIIIRPTTDWSNNIANIMAAGALNDNGTLASTALDTFYKPTEITTSNFVFSGGVWTGLGIGTTLTAAMTALICYINGVRQTVPLIATRTYTANKDTYVDGLFNSSGVATIGYTEVANGAASPALAANSIRLAKIVTGATIAATSSIIQGGLDTVTTSGQLNFIYNTSPTAAPIFTGANGGSLGGQQFWRSQSGVKELWGNIATIGVGASGSANGGVNFPAALNMTSAQSGQATGTGFTNSNMFAGIASTFPATGAITLYLQNATTAGQSMQASYYIRGV